TPRAWLACARWAAAYRPNFIETTLSTIARALSTMRGSLPPPMAESGLPPPEPPAMADTCLMMSPALTPRPTASLPQAATKVILRSEEHTSELQSRFDLVCRLLLEKKKHHLRRRVPDVTGRRHPRTGCWAACLPPRPDRSKRIAARACSQYDQSPIRLELHGRYRRR